MVLNDIYKVYENKAAIKQNLRLVWGNHTLGGNIGVKTNSLVSIKVCLVFDDWVIECIY